MVPLESILRKLCSNSFHHVGIDNQNIDGLHESHDHQFEIRIPLHLSSEERERVGLLLEQREVQFERPIDEDHFILAKSNDSPFEDRVAHVHAPERNTERNQHRYCKEKCEVQKH